MRPLRSMLYIPANKSDWVESAPREYDADGYVFDLEDSVPADEKAAARETLATALPDLAAADCGVFSRINPAETGLLADDLAAIVRPGLDAVIVPKLATAREVQHVASILDFLEARRDIEDLTEIVIVPETAQGMYNAYDLCATSERVAAIVAGSAPGADVNRALGFEWSPKGTETLYMRSKFVMEGRAAGLDQLFGGVWVDVEDLAGLRNELEHLAQLGYTGYQVIHPSHVEAANEVFTPDPEEVAYYERVKEAMQAAEEEGTASVTLDGEMIDVAHVETAERVLERAEAFGVEPAEEGQ